MYQLVTGLLHPQRLLMLAVAASLAWFWWRSQEHRRRLLLVIVPFCLLWLACLPLTAHFSHALLQSSYRPLREVPSDTQAIVVLSGFALPIDPRRPEPVLGKDTLYRCLHAAELYHRGPRCPLVLCGGLVNPDSEMPPLGQQMRTFLIKLGIPEADLLVEDRSSTTYENAIECVKLLADRGDAPVVLVTDASHMARAERCFLQVGLHVTPAPCVMQNECFEWSPAAFIPDANAAASVEEFVHEVLGLAWYKLKGRIP